MFTYVICCIAAILLLISLFKDRKKTLLALKTAVVAFERIMPQFLSILLLIGILLTVVDEATISRILGKDSGVMGMFLGAAAGSITLIPGFVAYPLAASLLKSGAGYGQITAFVTTLMMVGLVTLPMETKYFGKQTAIKRNLFSFVYAIIISFVIGGILS